MEHTERRLNGSWTANPAFVLSLSPASCSKNVLLARPTASIAPQNLVGKKLRSDFLPKTDYESFRFEARSTFFGCLDRTFTSRKHSTNRNSAFVAPEICMSAQTLYKEFEIKDHVSVVEGKGGLPKIVLNHESGSRAEIYLQGANVVSWVVGMVERLLLSETAVFESGKPIRGGIPICWPQFGPGKIQQHGFARNSEFKVVGSQVTKDGYVRAVFELTDNGETRAMWDYKFQLLYTVELTAAQLKCELKAVNKDDKPFDFSAALHTYFFVKDLENVEIRSLKGLKYVDRTLPDETPIEENDPVKISGPVDRAYFKAPAEVRLIDKTPARIVAIRKYGFKDTVVWSPAEAHPSPEWKNFVCVEPALVEPIPLEAGAEWEGWQNFTVLAQHTAAPTIKIA